MTPVFSKKTMTAPFKVKGRWWCKDFLHTAFLGLSSIGFLKEKAIGVLGKPLQIKSAVAVGKC